MAAPTAEQQRERRPRAEGPSPRRAAGDVYAALDLGTNNCRLLVARAEGAGFRVIDAFSRVVRLGEGVGATGALSDAAMERAMDALHICAEKMRRRRVTRARAIATEACRQAVNGPDFVARVKQETRIKLDVIASEEEARLAVAGCAPLVDTIADQVVVFDIGGGSTEIVLLNLSGLRPAQRREALMGGGRDLWSGAAACSEWTSLPVGVVSLAERFDDISDEAARFHAMAAHVSGLLTPFLQTARCVAADPKTLQLLGTSGTITTLAGVHLNLPRYRRADVDGLWVQIADLDAVTNRLVGMSLRERAQIPCVGADRAELVLSGAAILRAITAAWPAPRLRVADRGLREGMLYGLMRADQMRRRADENRP